MLVCDTHADTLYALASPDRPCGAPLDITAELLTAAGGVRVQCLALFVCTSGMQMQPTIVQKELRAFERLKQQGFHQIVDLSQAREGVANAMLTIEGGEAFGSDVAQVDHFADLGVRMAALVWNNENGVAHPAITGSNEGLTPLGWDIVRRMRNRHMAVDVSHLNERGFYDLLDGEAPPLASHSCARALCNHPRNLTDHQLRCLFEAGGYVGVNFYPLFLSNDAQADLNRVIDHIAHICDLGGEAHVGLGSDFDGIDSWPEGLRNAGDIPALLDGMRRRGFDETLVEAVAGLNFKHYLERI